jgi:hypothetical protein
MKLNVTVAGKTYQSSEALRTLIREQPSVVPEVLRQVPGPQLLQLFSGSKFDTAAAELPKQKQQQDLMQGTHATAQRAASRSGSLGYGVTEAPASPPATAMDAQLFKALLLDVSVPVQELKKDLGTDATYRRLSDDATHGADAYLKPALGPGEIKKAVEGELGRLDRTLADAAKGDPAAIAEVKQGVTSGLFHFIDNGALRIDENRALSRAMFERFGLTVMSDGKTSGASSPLWFAIEGLKTRNLSPAQQLRVAEGLLFKFAPEKWRLGEGEQQIQAFIDAQVR